MTFLRWIAVSSMAAAMVSFSGAGMAGHREAGFYGSLSGAFLVPPDAEVTGEGDFGRDSADLSMKNGIGILAAGGYSMPNGLQAEVEFGYRGLDMGTLEGIEFDGSVNTISLMANGRYSFETGKFRSYAGVGLGLARHAAQIDGISVDFGGDTFNFRSDFSENTMAFAYQGMAGIGYALSDTTEVTLGYRYFATGNIDLDDGDEMTYGTHTIEAGVVFWF